jgi:hypothetical protein
MRYISTDSIMHNCGEKYVAEGFRQLVVKLLHSNTLKTGAKCT